MKLNKALLIFQFFLVNHFVFATDVANNLTQPKPAPLTQAEKDLNLQEGYYELTEKNNDFCLSGQVKWYKSSDNSGLVLGIGARILITGINEGMQKITDGDVKDCSVEQQTRTFKNGNAGVLEKKETAKCTWGKYESTTVVNVIGETLLYHFTRKSSNQKSVKDLVIRCHLKKAERPEKLPPQFYNGEE